MPGGHAPDHRARARLEEHQAGGVREVSHSSKNGLQVATGAGAQPGDERGPVLHGVAVLLRPPAHQLVELRGPDHLTQPDPHPRRAVVDVDLRELVAAEGARRPVELAPEGVVAGELPLQYAAGRQPRAVEYPASTYIAIPSFIHTSDQSSGVTVSPYHACASSCATVCCTSRAPNR